MFKTRVKKQVGLYEVKNIKNTNILTIAINPKEYFEKYKDFSINKKHKSLKKEYPGMDFEAYSCTLHEYCFESKPKKIEQKKIQIINDSVQIKSVKKTQFAGLKNKGFYFHDGIVSFPFGYFFLNKVREEKEKHRTDLHTKIQTKNAWIFNIRKSCHTFVRKIKGININICSTTITIFIKLTIFAADKKFKINRRTNNKWKLEISQFTTDVFAEIC